MRSEYGLRLDVIQLFIFYLFTIFKEGKTHLAIRLVYHVALCNTTNRKHLYTIYTNMKKKKKKKKGKNLSHYLT